MLACAACTAVAWAAATPPAPAQTPPPVPRSQVPPITERAEALTREGDPATALELLETHLERAPRDYEARWRAARTAIVLALMADGRPAERDAWLYRALDHASEARELRPRGLEGRYWSVAVKGRLALHNAPRPTAELGAQVNEEARELLRLDPDHAGAHNALGRLGLEVLTLARWKRVAARLFVGGALTGFRWEETERHLRRAVELEPGSILYARDLGALLVWRGRATEASEVLRRALELPATDPAEAFFQAEARRLLREAEAGG